MFWLLRGFAILVFKCWHQINVYREYVRINLMYLENIPIDINLSLPWKILSLNQKFLDPFYIGWNVQKIISY